MIRIFLPLLMLFALAPHALAEPTTFLVDHFPPDGRHEITLSGTSGTLVTGSDVTSLSLELGYMQYLGEEWAFGVDFAFGSTSYKNTSVRALSLLGVAHYLFAPADFKNGPFALAAVGFGNAGGRAGGFEDDRTELGFRIGAGTRMQLHQGLYLRPEIYIEKLGELDPSLVIEFLNLSFIW